MVDPDQKLILLTTMEIFNLACDKISAIAFKEKRFDKFSLHKLTYYGIRDEFKLPAQLAIRAIGKVTESYKQERTAAHQFRKRGCVVYDDRVLSLKGTESVSIGTIEGRMTIPINCRQGGYRKGRYEIRWTLFMLMGPSI